MRKAALIALLLTGCSDPFHKFAEVFPNLRGQPIGVLYERWGSPERVVPPEIARSVDAATGRTVSEGPVYVWNVSSSYVFTNTSTSTGMIGTTPVSITTSTPSPETYYCNVRVNTDKDRRIFDIAVSGARGACAKLADRL